ncbi:sensor histidine kinase [Sphingorhabdus sp.]|jgi:signal transduction histidine kinase|uniref:sensor histidine kinase n=1 Tax=Sphingorhabdus sp. TaxID=1902408 RepID=UPI003783420C
MILTAAAWITILLIGGGAALDRVLTNSVEQNFDTQIEYVLTAMIASAEIGPDGEIRMNRPLGDQRFLEPNSGLYWQITGKDAMPFPSRSLWDRALRPPVRHKDQAVHFRNSDEFPDEPLRIAERSIKLPDSDVAWTFMVAQSRDSLDAQIQELRSVLVTSFFLLALGLIILAALQTFYGLWPLRAVRMAIAQMRSGQESRVTDALPDEVMPMVNELNALLDHNEQQAEESRRHAGNLAHALKTPLTVIMNSATAQAPDISETVIREATTMRRQVDHHLARARAVGRRGHSHSRALVWGSLESVERAVGRLYAHVRLDMAGDKAIVARVERQDLDEMLGNLIENAAKYGGGSVFVTVGDAGEFVEIIIEDDGKGIPESERERLFDRGARLDTGKPGTGLGLAIVRDVVEIYGGTVALEESEELGGLLVRLRLPKATS